MPIRSFPPVYNNSVHSVRLLPKSNRPKMKCTGQGACTTQRLPQEKFRETAAAPAKSLQSCPTLCDPTDGSPSGSPVPGILQARTLEWFAISFFSACMCNSKLDSAGGLEEWRATVPSKGLHDLSPKCKIGDPSELQVVWYQGLCIWSKDET